MKAFHENPYDGHTLEEVIAEMERWTGIEIGRIYVDKGYQGHDYPNKLKVRKSGQKRCITPTIRKELRRRSANVHLYRLIRRIVFEHRFDRHHDRCCLLSPQPSGRFYYFRC